MTARTDYERLEEASPEARRALRQEQFILEVTETLARAVERSGITRTELARRLGRSKGFVTQVLAGGRNLTLRTVADIADAVGGRLTVGIRRPAGVRRGPRRRHG